MRDDGAERCGRCGGDAFAGGAPYTFWTWIATEGPSRELSLHLCAPCGRDFPSQRARAEYLRLVLFA